MECLHFGTPPSNYECKESKTFHIHNVLDLPDTKGDDNVVKLPEFKCFGHTWRLDVYPGGEDKASDGNVTVYIHNLTSLGIALEYKITLLDADDNESHEITERQGEFYPKTGWVGNLKRATFAENQSKYLHNGTLKSKCR